MTETPNEPLCVFYDLYRLLVSLKMVKGPTLNLREYLQVRAPYTFTRLEGDLVLPLNRRYKPLGIATGTWVDYANYAHQAVPLAKFNLDCAPFQYPERVSGHTSHFLYDDWSSPWLSAAHKRGYIRTLCNLLNTDRDA